MCRRERRDPVDVSDARFHHDQPLFADVLRVDPSVSRADESTWHFLNRVDDPVFDRVRRAMNDWFARFPADARADLRGRLSSGDNEEFHAAWFELYLSCTCASDSRLKHTPSSTAPRFAPILL